MGELDGDKSYSDEEFFWEWVCSKVKFIDASDYSSSEQEGWSTEDFQWRRYLCF